VYCGGQGIGLSLYAKLFILLTDSKLSPKIRHIYLRLKLVTVDLRTYVISYSKVHVKCMLV